MADEILNRVANSSLVNIDLDDYYPKEKIVEFDIKDWLFQGLILKEKDFSEYGVNSDRWTDMGNYKVINKNNFHHDYAIWVTMQQAFKLAENIGKKYIHFLEYVYTYN